MLLIRMIADEREPRSRRSPRRVRRDNGRRRKEPSPTTSGPNHVPRRQGGGGPIAATDRLKPRRLPSLLRRAWHGLNQAFRHHAAPAGLTPDQFTVLRILCEHKPYELTQGGLAMRMCSDPNTITSLLQRMVRLGLLTRRQHPSDGRAQTLAVTVDGRRRYVRVRRIALGLQHSILAALPDEGRDRFLAELEIVSRACWQAAQISRLPRLP